MLPNKIIISLGTYRNPLAKTGIAEHREPTATMLRESGALDGMMNGVDIGFRKPDDVFQVRFSPANVRFMQSLEMNTCHFPYEYEITDTPLTRDIFRQLHGFITDLNITNTIVHPQCIKDREFFRRVWDETGNGPVLIENWMRTKEIGQQDFESLLNEGRYGIVLDTSHAAISTWADLGYPFRYFIPRLEHLIKLVHLSGMKLVPTFMDPNEPGLRRFCTAHHLINRLKPTERYFMEPAWMLLARAPNIPVIIETTLETTDEFPNDLKDEITYIEKVLSGTAPQLGD